MTLLAPILMAISLMWIPVGLLLIGKGEARGTGALTLMVGTLVIVSSIFMATTEGGFFGAALLFAYGLFYNIVGYSLYAGLTDPRSVGNASFTVGLITIFYIIICLTGLGDIGKSSYLALGCAGYLVLYIMVWLNAYGKFPAKTLGWSLIIWTFVGLWWPAFSLLGTGAFPF